jgi:hypothetical protein
MDEGNESLLPVNDQFPFLLLPHITRNQLYYYTTRRSFSAFTQINVALGFLYPPS